jgi:hypothetical protein
MTGRAGTATSPAPPAPPRRSPRQSAGSWTPPGSPPGTPSRCTLSQTASADSRWAEDRDSFTPFSLYLADGGLPQPRRDRAVPAAARLDQLERAQAVFDAKRALEDPFVLAELRSAARPSRPQPGPHVGNGIHVAGHQVASGCSTSHRE